MRQIDRIILHCSATKEGINISSKEIEVWHKERGFTKIGYHYVILLDGTIQAGRSEEEKGAHCQGYNSNSIGICYIGGLDRFRKSKDTRTDKQKTALNWLVKDLKKRYPNATIHGHNEFSKKDCPCFDVKKEF